jgi:hypothetical protein
MRSYMAMNDTECTNGFITVCVVVCPEVVAVAAVFSDAALRVCASV